MYVKPELRQVLLRINHKHDIMHFGHEIAVFIFQLPSVPDGA